MIATVFASLRSMPHRGRAFFADLGEGVRSQTRSRPSSSRRMPELHLVLLAAGQGQRMKSAEPKVLHRVAGVPMIDYVLAAAEPLGAATTTVVTGHGADRVRAALANRNGVQFALQEPQLGTGHALLQTGPLLRGTAR